MFHWDHAQFSPYQLHHSMAPFVLRPRLLRDHSSRSHVRIPWSGLLDSLDCLLLVRGMTSLVSPPKAMQHFQLWIDASAFHNHWTSDTLSLCRAQTTEWVPIISAAVGVHLENRPRRQETTEGGPRFISYHSAGRLNTRSVFPEQLLAPGDLAGSATRSATLWHTHWRSIPSWSWNENQGDTDLRLFICPRRPWPSRILLPFPCRLRGAGLDHEATPQKSRRTSYRRPPRGTRPRHMAF